jgi:tetratricopeptide (TPR) repeat protein
VAQGDAGEARIWMRSQLVATSDPVLLLAAAESAFEIAEWEPALSFYERALALDPGSADARVGRARCLAELGRTAEAAAALAHPLDGREPPDPTQLAPLAELAGLDPGARARVHLRLAEAAAARFDADAASRARERAAALDPGLAGAAAREGALYEASLGRTERTQLAAERAVELGTADARVWEALGEARRRQGRVAEARVAFERARELDPSSARARVGLSQVALQSGDSAAARALLHEAVEVVPSDLRARRMLAGLLRSLGELDAALAVLEGSPRPLDAEALREVAAVRSARGDAEGAAHALARAIEIEPENGALHAELVRAHEVRGDAAAAATARRAAQELAVATRADDAAGLEATGDGSTAGSLVDLVATFPTQLAPGDPSLRTVALLLPTVEQPEGRLRAWLAPRRIDAAAAGRALARALAERLEVVAPDEIPIELVPAEQEALRAFETDPRLVARLNEALGTEAVFAARLRPGAGPDALVVELRMGVGATPPAVRQFRNEAVIADGRAAFATWNPTALATFSLALVLALLPALRGWGELVVGIQYASLGKGFFGIRLSRRPEKPGAGRSRADPRREQRFRRRFSLLGRYQRSMVGRETVFRWLPARRYYVQVHGLLEDPVSDEVVGNYCEEQVVEVRRGRSNRVEFDFRPKECAVELSVLRDRQPVAKALAAVRGQPESLRYVRSGRAIFALPPGLHAILVGVDDVVLERRITIDGFTPQAISLDVANPAAAVLRGCSEAVEHYVQGSLVAAADALERAGHAEQAARVRGEHHAQQGDTAEAARCFEQAGHFEEAASLVSEQTTDPAAAAALFEKAGNHEQAAEAWRAAGDPARAAAHFEAVYRYDDAIECYRQARQLEKVCDLCEKTARHLDAADAALELGDEDRAIRNLQAIDLRDPAYVTACRRLGEIFAARDEHELAVQKLEQAVDASGGAEAAPLDLHQRHAEALERAGRRTDALAAYESIRARDFHYPGIGSRIDVLRAALDAGRGADSPTPAPADATAPVESRYELLEEIGRGGMGVVYKARDRRLGRVVALKRLPENLRHHPTAVRLFLREARAAAALNHRNIVTLLDAGQEGDVYFLTMEFLEGLPLHEVLARRGRLSPRDVARLGAQAAAGLEYAHSRGVVHRDIKTSNLFFTRDRALKIMDFGLAKMTEEVRRSQTVVGGTPYYMAPEQAAGEDVDARADLYALGVTLYELLAGEVPFREGDIARHHRETPPPDPRAKAPDVPEELAAVVQALLAKRPEGRPASAAEVAARLQQIGRSLAGPS